MFRNLLVAAAVVAVMSFAASPVSAQFGTGNSPNNLFSQYNTQPGASTVQAGMYPAPHYVPENVGHTYYTYQPIMPHEMMYQHSRNYYNYYNTGGYYSGGCDYDSLNKTQVRWQAGANHMGHLPLSRPFATGLHWKMQQKKYGLNGSGGGGHGRGGRLRGGLGCAGGDCGASCGSGEACGGGCAGGECAAANQANNPLRR